MLKSEKNHGDTFWYVLERYFEESDENGKQIPHKTFYTMPYEFHTGDDMGIVYDPERMFDTESEANEYAFAISVKEGY